MERTRMSEKSFQQQTLSDLNSRPDVRVFRNNVGVGYTANGTPIRFGLHVGSGDLIGFRIRVITPEMVGKTIAQFLSVELKSKRGRESKEQANWREQINKAGGKTLLLREKK
jgi:hypothetical protein